MEILFESTGSTAGFENWFNAFKDINNSLLVEVDLTTQQFSSKAYTDDKTVVKYGTLSFTDAGLNAVSVINENNEKVSVSDWTASNTERIKFGINDRLKEFINVVNLFSSTQHNMIIKFGNLDDEFVTEKIEFKSDALTMVASCADIDGFFKISDDKFVNTISAVEQPMEFNIGTDVNKMLQKISSIYSVDVKKDVIDFTVVEENGEWVLRAVDHTGSSYDFKLAYMNAESTGDESVIPIPRAKFFMATKGDVEGNVVTISGKENASKIKITSGNNFITIIAAIRV